jgi:hypothetical protein
MDFKGLSPLMDAFDCDGCGCLESAGELLSDVKFQNVGVFMKTDFESSKSRPQNELETIFQNLKTRDTAASISIKPKKKMSSEFFGDDALSKAVLFLDAGDEVEVKGNNSLVRSDKLDMDLNSSGEEHVSMSADPLEVSSLDLKMKSKPAKPFEFAKMSHPPLGSRPKYEMGSGSFKNMPSSRAGSRTLDIQCVEDIFPEEFSKMSHPPLGSRPKYEIGSGSFKNMPPSRAGSCTVDMQCVEDIFPEKIRNPSFSRSFGGLRQQHNTLFASSGLHML